MRYLKIIVYIIVIASLITVAVSFVGHKPEMENVVMTVNKYQVTRDMVAEDEERQEGWHVESRTELLNSLAIRQLLIEEAQRQKIDKEPAFRKDIKDFYEQSLINLLIERKNKESRVEVSDNEIRQYEQAFGKIYTFLICDQLSKEDDWQNAESVTQPFDNLSSTMQPVLAIMSPGESRQVYDTGNQRYWVKLIEVIGKSNPAAVPPANVLEKILIANKEQQMMSLWIDGLLNNADIRINEQDERK